jgi:hypothetical protein
MTRTNFQIALSAICVCLNQVEINQLEKLIGTLEFHYFEELPTPYRSSPKFSMIWAILIGLYYHDRLNQIPILLAKFSDSSLTLAYAIAKIAAVSEIAQIYQESDRINPLNRLIPQLTKLLISYPDQIAQLDKANILVQQGQSQAIAEASLGKNSIAYALYVFLSTPNSWAIAVKRAGKLQISVSVLTAVYQSELPNLPQFSSQIHHGAELGDRLFANWAGISLIPGITISGSISSSSLSSSQLISEPP